MFSSVEWLGRIKHAENMAGGPRANRPVRVAAEMAVDEEIVAEEQAF